MFKWVVIAYVACTVIAVVGFVWLGSLLITEVSDVGLQHIVDKIWCGSKGCKP